MLTSFGASLQKKHDGVNIFLVTVFFRKLLVETLKARISPRHVVVSGALTGERTSNLREILRRGISRSF